MYKTIAATKTALLNKEISFSEMVEETLARIQTKNPELNIFLTLNETEAKKAALEFEFLLKNDPDSLAKLPLLGMPLGHKDIFMTKGLRTTAGARLLENHVAAYSATAVTKLKDSGAITIGKLNCDAWAHGSSGENSDFGATKNPVNPEYVAGGSSSGSAAAVAAGLVLGATATDTGGSIRLPANFTGTVGFKPTYGRVSRYGVIAMASSLDSIGHVTANVEDSALLFSVTAGEDFRDGTTANSPKFSMSGLTEKTDFKGLRIGVPTEYFSPIKDKEIKENFDKTVKTIESLGGEIIEISLPHTEYAAAVYYIIQPAEVSSNLARFDGVRFGAKRHAFSSEAIRRIMIGTYTLSAGYYDAYYTTAQKVRTLIKQDFDKAFAKVDLLIAPVSPTPAFKLGEKMNDPLAMYLSDILTIPVNLAGLPALAMPTGKNKQGLPLGIQLIGNRFAEEKIFPVAYLLEKKL
jgi:aspartyl-tRNA(Asn)/glutamyl-tRNA(Gln) amidotransferase subunit A